MFGKSDCVYIHIFFSILASTGDHWLGNADQYYQHHTSGLETGLKEFVDMYNSHDAADLAKKYTEDAIFIHYESGVISGRQGIKSKFVLR